MQRYEKYKDSGIEWIGEIPEHWDIKKIKHRCYVKGRVGWKGLKSSEFLTDGYSYLVTGTDFKNDTVDWGNCYHIDEERYNEDPYIQLQNEDLLITKDGTIGKLAVVTNLDKPACLNSGIFVVRSTKEDFSTRYLLWVLKSSIFTDFNGLTAYGSTIQHLYQNVFVEFAFAFPPVNTQISIAEYLQRKTAEIDRIIANKQKLIALYEEEKQAIINQAVTKGLDPNVKMKDSGVEWLGEIPEGWEVKQLRSVVQMKSGEGITSESIKESGEYPVYGGNGLRGYFENYTHMGDYVLIGRQGALCGNINYATGYFWASEHAIVCTLKGVYNTKWFGELLRVMNLNQYSVSAAQPGLSVENLKALKIPVPPINEQQTIVAHIEKESTRLDTIISKFNKQIDLLQEYRTTLISEVVTGKVKVNE
jgi:type I restriction enzyme S subunit